MLCTLIASTSEFLWLHNFRNVLLNIDLHTAVRYTDNRAFHFYDRHWTQPMDPIAASFCNSTVQDNPEEKFLGII